jgi:hypothetical protein
MTWLTTTSERGRVFHYPIFTLNFTTSHSRASVCVLGLDSPDARLIQASVGVQPLVGGCVTKQPP